MAKVRVQFDTLINYVPKTKVRLSFDARIVEIVAFEATLVKVQQKRAYDLSEDEQAAVECLVRSKVEASTSCIEELLLDDIAFGKFRALQKSPIRI